MDILQQLVRKLGIHANLLGYHFLIYAIELVAEDDTYLLGMTKRLYPEIALHFHTSIGSVDRNLRTAMQVLWDRGNLAFLEKLVGYELDCRPSNSEVIDILASYYNQIRSHNIPI